MPEIQGTESEAIIGYCEPSAYWFSVNNMDSDSNNRFSTEFWILPSILVLFKQENKG